MALSKKGIKDLIRDCIYEQINDSAVEEAICDTICAMDFREKIGDALESSIE